MKAVEKGAIEFITVMEDIIATCTNFSIPDSRRIQVCLTNSMNLIRVVTPLISYPETTEAKRVFLDELPKSLSTLYTECVEYHPIGSHEKLTNQKDIQEKISRCFSRAESFSSSFPQLAEIIGGNAPFEKIRTDLTKILVQFNSFRSACDLPLPEIYPSNKSLKQCLSGVRSLFLAMKDLGSSEIGLMQLSFVAIAFYQELPSVISDCGMLGLHGEL
jgi:hypothetical protein